MWLMTDILKKNEQYAPSNKTFILNEPLLLNIDTSCHITIVPSMAKVKTYYVTFTNTTTDFVLEIAEYESIEEAIAGVKRLSEAIQAVDIF